MSGFTSFIAELQRRHVIRAAVAHVIVFWLLIQVADVVLPYVGIVEEPVRWALIAGIAARRTTGRSAPQRANSARSRAYFANA